LASTGVSVDDSDAWRLLRDCFYDSKMHNVDWKAVHARYLPLVQSCAKRVDDVLGLMASKTSALHSFVYGGEYSIPEQPPLLPEWKGHVVTEIPERDMISISSMEWHSIVWSVNKRCGLQVRRA
jgi:Tricorn protease C1 domain